MKDYRTRYGKTALVIGGSTTVGEQFSRQLAAAGMDVVIVARNQQRLELLAESIRSTATVDVQTIAIDLMEDGALERLSEQLADREIGLLVCNANLHKVNHFDKMPLATKFDMIRMNVMHPVALCELFGKPMVERGRGGIVLVGSLNSLMGLEVDSVFQGTKAFLLIFGEGLWSEFRERGVKVAVSMVNGIEGSSSYEAKVSGRSQRILKNIGISMPPERIVKETLRQFERDYPVIIPDFRVPYNRFFATVILLSRMVQSRAMTLALDRMTRNLLDGDEVLTDMGRVGS